MLFGWFGTVISETRAGLLQDPQVDRSFRWGMVWFIFSEVMFFAAFFGALFYTRVLSVPWLGGEGSNAAVMTHLLLWPQFTQVLAVVSNPQSGFISRARRSHESMGNSRDQYRYITQQRCDHHHRPLGSFKKPPRANDYWPN